ncbi:COX12-like protein [Mya arenaria]|uniref:COX12-like protein n=1 Tax=Mya arenaria TaxID=6604 RepID=A0ABY7DD55_MYAAR|nr:COX12-like protein [Mya arenaria]
MADEATKEAPSMAERVKNTLAWTGIPVAMPAYDAGWAKGAAPFDSRFPHQNQLPNCERNYIDYQRCIRLKGEDYPNCNYFKASYLQLCPKKYVSEWDEQVEAGSYKYLPDNIPEH